VSGTTPDRYAYKNWFPSGNSYSFTWAVTGSLLNFLYFDFPGGTPNGIKLGTSSTGTSGNSKGDVFFYDWGLGEGISHASIMVGTGTSANGCVGDYVDYHSKPKKHIFWSLRHENADLMDTTVITLVHISASN
jgi:hypothetical protein